MSSLSHHRRLPKRLKFFCRDWSDVHLYLPYDIERLEDDAEGNVDDVLRAIQNYTQLHAPRASPDAPAALYDQNSVVREASAEAKAASTYDTPTRGDAAVAVPGGLHDGHLGWESPNDRLTRDCMNTNLLQGPSLLDAAREDFVARLAEITSRRLHVRVICAKFDATPQKLTFRPCVTISPALPTLAAFFSGFLGERLPARKTCLTVFLASWIFRCRLHMAKVQNAHSSDFKWSAPVSWTIGACSSGTGLALDGIRCLQASLLPSRTFQRAWGIQGHYPPITSLSGMSKAKVWILHSA